MRVGLRHFCIWMLVPLSVIGCSQTPAKHDLTASREEVLWLDRVTYGINTQVLRDLRTRGSQSFVADQLASVERPLPVPIAQQIEKLELNRGDPTQVLIDLGANYKRINAMPDGMDKEQARKQLNESGDKLAYAAMRRHLLRAIYSPDQLQEQMQWFWLNHFSVFQYKANVRWLIGDYEERALRAHSLGHFRELVMATLTHPAMLQYLDNAQNAVGHINENYARELMELHTLGVDGGYTQQDVQELARVLTGVGVVSSPEPPKLKAEWQTLYRREHGFEFNPARHDFGDKTLLGSTIHGAGFSEVEHAVDILVRQPACARMISKKLAQYFVADQPPPALVDRMSKVFLATDGDITKVLEAMFAAPEFKASLGSKFKDPMHYVISAVRLSYDTRPLVNSRPLVNWLNALGEPLYGRSSPDGYPLTEGGWASSGQMSRRFEIARSIASGNAGLFDPEDGSAATSTGFPRLATRLYFDAIESTLSKHTLEALDHSSSQQEWNTFLLASPESNYR